MRERRRSDGKDALFSLFLQENRKKGIKSVNKSMHNSEKRNLFTIQPCLPQSNYIINSNRLQSMDFFTKYKDLFEVPQGLSIPTSRLRLENDLFIDKPYIATYSQEYSLDSKLRQLKKDYNSFESELTSFASTIKTPKRALSRRGKEAELKAAQMDQKYNQNRQMEKRQVWAKQKQQLLTEKLKREAWLKDQQSNILKHSQIDHIFNSKLNNIYQLEDIKVQTLPKPVQSHDSSFDVRRAKHNNFTIKQRSKANLEVNRQSQEQKPAKSSVVEGARQRREKASSTLQFRRKKLQQLLRTLW